MFLKRTFLERLGSPQSLLNKNATHKIINLPLARNYFFRCFVSVIKVPIECKKKRLNDKLLAKYREFGLTVQRQVHVTGSYYAQVQKTRKDPDKKEKKITKEAVNESVEIPREDPLDSEIEDLFPIIATTEIESSSGIISTEFEAVYSEIQEKSHWELPKHVNPRHGRLTNLIFKTTNRDEAKMLAKIFAQWRRRLLPITRINTRFLVKKLVAPEISSYDLALEMIADRSKYALKPNREVFRYIMLSIANKIISTSELAEKDNVTEPKMEEDTLKTEEGKEETRRNELSALDDLYKTFGLMTYYELSPYDAHLYTILISASLKSNTKEGWRRADETCKEFIKSFDVMDKSSMELNTISHSELIQGDFGSKWSEESGINKDVAELLEKEKFDEYTNSVKISRLVTGIEVAIIMEKWYQERGNMEMSRKLNELRDRWEKEIIKIEEHIKKQS
ncbi:12430_t:CDS:2 [Acaulospora morrowiae]|uniref:12430_t:CDS:1 n=1 Tax=Acaulospora morrowiae TaxID=94023 RepID=A0A9N9DIC2_9GLOM|nr:12430_t:CDS:2 [Acaulospora morrowiae]